MTEYPTFEQTIEVIRNECVHLEAFEPGKAHDPSVAFCCIFRLCSMKLDVPQMNVMLRHKVALIRCVGLLFLRIAGDVKNLMNWCLHRAV
jgi:hypothetical protein